MKKKKEASDNPLHKEYGIISNSFFILGKIKKYCPYLFFIMALGAVTNSLMQYMWSVIGKFVIDMVEQQADSPGKDIAPLLSLLLAVAAVEIVSMAANTITGNRMWFNMINVRQHVITERVEKALSMNYQTLEQPDILNMESKASQATGGNNDGIEGLMHSVYDTAVQLLLMISTLAIVTILDWRLIIVIAALSFVQYLFFRYTVKKDKKETWDRLAPVWRKVYYMERTTQDFDYAKDIRLFGMKNWLSGKQHEILSEKQERMIRSRDLWIRNSIFAHGISVISTAAVYGVLIFSVVDKGISIGDFTMYLGISMTFSSAMTNFLNSIGDYRKRSLQVDDFRSFMDLETEDESACIPVPDAEKYVFEFRNVSFRYSGQEAYALKNLNLTLEAGKRLAVVGLNGAGKTTFIKLLLRLYDPAEGEILLNGTDIRKFRRSDYYKLFSPVFQNVELFAFPMSENVSMKPPSGTDKAYAVKCLEKAGLSEKLASLEKGADTELLKVLHEDGTDLSGGEKQKLALARALYKDAPVIVLDEPTAALDAIAEYNLYKSFDEIIGEKSAVYISHRLSSTRFCDKIAMFRAGEMVEYGTHEELLSENGAYAEMFEIQAQYYKEGKDYAEAEC